MTEHRIIEQEAITDDGIERRETLRKGYVQGARTVTRRPVARSPVAWPARSSARLSSGPSGAVVGGAIGAATGATAGVVDQKDTDDTVVVTRDERRL